MKKRVSKVAHNPPRPFYFTVQPRPQPTAQNWFFILWNLGTRQLFSYLCLKFQLSILKNKKRLIKNKILSRCWYQNKKAETPPPIGQNLVEKAVSVRYDHRRCQSSSCRVPHSCRSNRTIWSSLITAARMWNLTWAWAMPLTTIVNRNGFFH